MNGTAYIPEDDDSLQRKSSEGENDGPVIDFRVPRPPDAAEERDDADCLPASCTIVCAHRVSILCDTSSLTRTPYFDGVASPPPPLLVLTRAAGPGGRGKGESVLRIGFGLEIRLPYTARTVLTVLRYLRDPSSPFERHLRELSREEAERVAQLAKELSCARLTARCDEVLGYREARATDGPNRATGPGSDPEAHGVPDPLLVPRRRISVARCSIERLGWRAVVGHGDGGSLPLRWEATYAGTADLRLSLTGIERIWIGRPDERLRSASGAELRTCAIPFGPDMHGVLDALEDALRREVHCSSPAATVSGRSRLRVVCAWRDVGRSNDCYDGCGEDDAASRQGGDRDRSLRCAINPDARLFDPAGRTTVLSGLRSIVFPREIVLRATALRISGPSALGRDSVRASVRLVGLWERADERRIDPGPRMTPLLFADRSDSDSDSCARGDEGNYSDLDQACAE